MLFVKIVMQFSETNNLNENASNQAGALGCLMRGSVEIFTSRMCLSP